MTEAKRRWRRQNIEKARRASRESEKKRRELGKSKPRSGYPSRKPLQRALLAELKRVPCSDCGGTFDPVCMDFDHREGERKVLHVSGLVGYADDLLLAEIAKCDVVCSNCHRLRTKKRRGTEIVARQAAQLELWRSKA